MNRFRNIPYWPEITCDQITARMRQMLRTLSKTRRRIGSSAPQIGWRPGSKPAQIRFATRGGNLSLFTQLTSRLATDAARMF